MNSNRGKQENLRYGYTAFKVPLSQGAPEFPVSLLLHPMSMLRTLYVQLEGSRRDEMLYLARCTSHSPQLPLHGDRVGHTVLLTFSVLANQALQEVNKLPLRRQTACRELSGPASRLETTPAPTQIPVHYNTHKTRGNRRREDGATRRSHGSGNASNSQVNRRRPINEEDTR